MRESITHRLGVGVLAVSIIACTIMVIVVDAKALAVQVEAEVRTEKLLADGLIDRGRTNESLAAAGSPTRFSVSDPTSPVGYLEFQRRFLPLDTIASLRSATHWIFATIAFQAAGLLLVWRAVSKRDSPLPL